jgi:hypothetical protein
MRTALGKNDCPAWAESPTERSEAKHTGIRAQTQRRATAQNYRKYPLNTLLSEEPVFFIASAVVAMIRWQSPTLALGHLLVVCLMAISFSPRLAVGYALLSVGIDLIALPVEAYTGQRGGLVPFGAWECAGLFSMIVRSRD